MKEKLGLIVDRNGGSNADLLRCCYQLAAEVVSRHCEDEFVVVGSHNSSPSHFILTSLLSTTIASPPCFRPEEGLVLLETDCFFFNLTAGLTKANFACLPGK